MVQLEKWNDLVPTENATGSKNKLHLYVDCRGIIDSENTVFSRSKASQRWRLIIILFTILCLFLIRIVGYLRGKPRCDVITGIVMSFFIGLTDEQCTQNLQHGCPFQKVFKADEFFWGFLEHGDVDGLLLRYFSDFKWLTRREESCNKSLK